MPRIDRTSDLSLEDFFVEPNQVFIIFSALRKCRKGRFLGVSFKSTPRK